MNTSSIEIRSLLLDLIGPARPVAQRRVDAVDPRGWAKLLAAAVEHRLLPMLHWNLSHRLPHLVLPAGLREHCAVAHRQSTLLALSQQRDLLLVYRRLAYAGIPCVALKGAYLARHAYPEPGLRPLRDLDILIPGDRAIEAYKLLRPEAEEPCQPATGDPPQVMVIGHHLPGFQLAGGGTYVELHHEVFSKPSAGSHVTQGNSASPPVDPAHDPGFWARCLVRDLAGEPISYMAPTDLLHHIIVHAVYAHEFNNGPLFLADLAWLLDSHEIDWPLFWRLIETHGQERGAALALRMMETYWGPRRIDWTGMRSFSADIPAAVAEAAAQLSLRDLEVSSLLKALQDLRDCPGLSGKALLALRRLFPDGQTLEAIMVPVGARPWVATLYLRRLRYLLARGILAARSRVSQDLNALASVRGWLRAENQRQSVAGKSIAKTALPH